MPRRVQDIVPNTHRSIRDIPLERPSVVAPIQPSKKRSRSDDGTSEVPIQRSNMPRMPITPSRQRETSGAKKWLFLLMGIVVIVAVVGYVASVYFSSASFTIVSKVVPVTVNGTYISQSTPGKGVLAYELAIVKGDTAMTVTATDGPKISTSAKGKITLYNTYSTQPQRLIAGTRLADDTGRIYRLASSLVIPGYTTSASSTVVPGSISALVVADQPGQSYNITKSDPVSDFKIVAYKGSSKYESIYGRLAADIAGGFVGAKKTISPAVLASTTADLQSRIVTDLLNRLKASIPAGYLMYPKAYVATFGTPVIGGTDPKTATVALQGTVYGILFKRSELVVRVAGDQAVAVFDDFAYETPGLDSLDFSIANTKDFSPEKKNTLIVKLKGDITLVGTIPVDALKQKLAGLSLTETSSVLRSYKPVIEIDKSSGSITPPWSKVPDDVDRITVEVQPASPRTEP